MPSTLNALLEDKKIAQVKAATALKSDGIPFMLLPVRIETRFMEVGKATDNTGADQMDAVLDALLYIQVNMLQATTEPVLKKQLSVTVKQLDDVTEQVKLLTGITGKDKDMLQQMVNSFNDLQVILALRFQSALYAAFTASAAKFAVAVKALAIYTLVYLVGAEAFISALQKAADGIKKLTDQKTIPYQNVKNKKSLYNFITAALEEAIAFYKGAKLLADAITYLSKEEQAKIQLLHIGIKNSNPVVGGILKNIYVNDRGWEKFMAETVVPSLQQITDGTAMFDGTTIPFLKTKPEPPTANSRDLLFTGIKTILAIQKFQAKPQPKFGDLKMFKASIGNKLDAIKKAVSQPMTIAQKQQSYLQKIYTDLGANFDMVKGSIDTFRVKRVGQEISRKKVIDFLAPDVRKTIGNIGIGIITIKPPKVRELWVRIYPDDIFIHSHEEALTDAEINAGKAFWNAWWASSNDEETGKAAWGKLCEFSGTRRASWIANVLNPIKFVTAKNTANIAAKPFISLIKAKDTANFLATQIEGTNFTLLPTAYYTGIGLNTITAFSSSLQSIQTSVKTFTNTPTFFVEALRVPLVRIGGNLQTMRTKADQLTAKEKVTLNDKLQALASVEKDYQNLTLAVDALYALTVEDYLTKVPPPFDFPALVAKENSWSKAPHTYMLPERFVVITMQGNNFSHVMVSNPVMPELQMGPDPEKFNAADGDPSTYHIDENGDLVIEEGLRWLADYPEAVKKGMGVTIPLTSQQYDTGFTKLLVLGVKETDAVNSAKLVEKLFTNHVYSPDGMTLLKIGTPTNNTEQGKAGYKRTDDDSDERYAIEINSKVFSETETNPLLISDAKRLGNGLGISLPVMQKINNKTSTEISKAYAMNRALWHATIGHTMEEMWDHVFTYDNIRMTEDFFTKYCIGRGVLPSVRIGMQPYGFMPTTAYSRYQAYKDIDAYHLPPISPIDLNPIFPHPTILEQKKQVRYYARLREVLKILNGFWTSIRNEKVINYEKLANGNPQKDFVEMLGLNATSVEYFNRYGVNIVRQGINSSNMLGSEYNIRDNMGSNFIFYLFKNLMLQGYNKPDFIFPDESLTAPIDKFKLEDAKYSRITTQLEGSRMFRARYLKPSTELKELNGAKINNLPFSNINGLEKIQIGNEKLTYIEWLLNNDMDTVLAGNNPAKFPSRSLLFLLMRQSLMQANQEAALNILQFEKLITPDLRRIAGDEQTYDSYTKTVKEHTFNTKWHLLLKDLDDLRTSLIFKDIRPGNPFYNYLISKTNAPAGRSSMAIYMNKPTVNSILNGYPNAAKHKEFIAKVDTVRTAFTTLNTVPTAELNFLLAEHLDVCSYRLDAWMTGLANKRLAEQRSKPANATGIHIGAYGWVENLKRDDNKQKADLAKIPDELKPNDDTSVYKDPDNEGFIHAPSINHAITAAVLRSAYKANTAQENINNRLSVNISSSRVRMALKLIDGVQNGLSVGALLGFQFEKGLHERYKKAELDKYILPFRKMFPLVVPVKDNAQPNKAPAYNTNVVNGSAFLNKIFDTVKWMDFPSKDTLFKVLMDKKASLPWLTQLVGVGNDYEQVAREIDHMADAFDALGDLAVSESVYQIVNGNHIRAAAMVTSLASGKNIPDPQIVETVRTGAVITQRVLLNMEAKLAFANLATWNFGATPRSKAEPTLNNWLANIIGDPTFIKSIVTYKDNNIDKTDVVSLSDLKIQPIDCLFLWANEADIKTIIEYTFRKRYPNLPTKTVVAVDIKSRLDKAIWPAAIRTFSETSLLLQQLRSLLQTAKPAGADSFLSPTAKLNELNPAWADDVQLRNRLNVSVADFKAAIANVTMDLFVKDVLDKKKVVGGDTQPTAFTLGQLTLVSNFLMSAVLLGVPNSVPRTVFAATDDLVAISKDLAQQAIAVCQKLKLNVAAAETIIAKITATSTPKEKIAICTDAFKALFGKMFMALPIFTSQNAPEISTQLNFAPDKNLLRTAGLMAMEDWMQGVTKVRKPMAALQMIDMTVMGLNNNSIPMQPVQLPYKDGDFWAGTEYAKDFKLDGDKLSLVLVYPERWLGNMNMPQAGLVIDEWMEIIPNKSETTGIALNYNQPDATAPQTVLLAVTPVETGKWVWEDLVYTLIDTLELAKNRAVEPDHLHDSPLSHILPGILSEVAPPQMDGSDDPNALGVQAVMDFNFNRETLNKIVLI